MDKKKNVKPLNERLESTVIGVFLILLLTALGINVGKVARTLAFPLIYFFGGSYYLILAYFAVRGFLRIILGKRFKHKNIAFSIGVVVFFVASIFLLDYVMFHLANYSFATDLSILLNEYNAGLGNYYSPIYLNLFEVGTYWSSGLIGIVLGGIFASNTIVLTLAIIFYVIAFALMGFRLINKSFIRIFKNKKQKRAEKKQKKNKEIEEKKLLEEQKKQQDELEKQKIIEEEKEQFVQEPKEEKVEIQYGFEPESLSFDEEDIIFKNIDTGRSLDEGYIKERNNDESDFYQLSFDGKERKISTDSSDEFKQNSYFNDTKNEDDDFIQRKEEPEIKIDLHQDEEIKNDLLVDNLKPKIDLEFNEEEKSPIDIIEQYNEDNNVLPIDENKNEFFIKEENDIKKETLNQNNKEEIKIEQKIETPKKKERINWVPPSNDILDYTDSSKSEEINRDIAESRVGTLNQILSGFNVGARCIGYTLGNNFTRYNIEYEPNVSVRAVEKLVNDISMRLGGVSARFVPYVVGESYSGLEVSNEETTMVAFREIIDALPDKEKHPLAVGFGKDLSGKVVYEDFNKFPHLLVAGTTGSGKSVYIHSIISTLIMRASPDDLRLVLVDPKKVEMVKYRDMPHLLCPIITESSKAKVMLSKLVDEMERRYEMFADTNGEATEISDYNKWAKAHDKEQIPYIVVVLDEYADLVDTCKEISQPVVSIAQKARACGIHMLISTQRPSTNVITGVIKGNLPTHVALCTSSYTDSMTILGEGGAEKLNGKGDMLVQSPLLSKNGLARLQGCYVKGIEISRIVGYLKEHYETHYDENYLDLVDHAKEAGQAKVDSGEIMKEADEEEENKYQSIKAWVMTQAFVSMSKIQRECQVGFNRAGRFFSRLQKEGIVSTQQDGATKGCKVLVRDDIDNSFVVTSDELMEN